MADLFRTAIVPVANVAFARSLVAAISPGGVGMWTTGLAPKGGGDVTHYISTGYVSANLALITPLQVWEDGVLTSVSPGSPSTVVAAAAAKGFSCTLQDVQALFSSVDCTTQDPFVAMDRLGLALA